MWGRLYAGLWGQGKGYMQGKVPCKAMGPGQRLHVGLKGQAKVPCRAMGPGQRLQIGL